MINNIEVANDSCGSFDEKTEWEVFMMLILSAFAIGIVAGLQNVTEPTGASDVTEAVKSTEMGLLAPTKASDPRVLDHLNVTIQDHSSMWHIYLHQCSAWKPINHIFFQVTNACFLLAFLAPHTPSGLIWLRVCLVLGCAFSGFYAWVECNLDAVIWDCAFLVINFVYLAVHFYLLRPIKFHKEIEEVTIPFNILQSLT